MLVTSKTPGADGAPASNASASSDAASSEGSGSSATQPSSPSASSGCKDLPTPDGHTCQQQKDWGKCDADFVKTNGYCKATCGACGSSSSSGSGSDKKVEAFSDKSGRKMLQRHR